MKTPNSVSQKIRILLKTNTRKDFKKSWPTEKYEHEKYEHVQHSILSWGSFCLNYCSNVAWHGVDQSVALLRCYESPGCSDSGLQLFCIVWVWHIATSSSQYPIDFLWVKVRRVCWPIKNRDTMVLKPGTGSFGTVCRCQVLLENEICISIKFGQQQEA